MANQNTLLNVELGEQVLEIAGHGLVGQHRMVWAGTMVTGINGQHLTGQKMVTTLGMGGKQGG